MFFFVQSDGDSYDCESVSSLSESSTGLSKEEQYEIGNFKKKNLFEFCFEIVHFNFYNL